MHVIALEVDPITLQELSIIVDDDLPLAVDDIILLLYHYHVHALEKAQDEVIYSMVSAHLDMYYPNTTDHETVVHIDQITMVICEIIENLYSGSLGASLRSVTQGIDYWDYTPLTIKTTMSAIVIGLVK